MKTAEEMRKIALEAQLKMQEATKNHAEEILTTSIFPNIKKMAEQGCMATRIKTNARTEVVAIIKNILAEYGYKVDIISNFILIKWQE